MAGNWCDVFNIRLSKCGGFIPGLRLGQFAAHHGLGSLLLTMQRLSDAEDALREALRTQPDRLDALNDLGVSLMLQGKTAPPQGNSASTAAA